MQSFAANADRRFVSADGESIRRERLRRGMSQEALAERLGITPVALSRWESGGQIRHRNVEILGQVLHVCPSHLAHPSEALSRNVIWMERVACVLVEEITDWLSVLSGLKPSRHPLHTWAYYRPIQERRLSEKLLAFRPAPSVGINGQATVDTPRETPTFTVKLPLTSWSTALLFEQAHEQGLAKFSITYSNHGAKAVVASLVESRQPDFVALGVGGFAFGCTQRWMHERYRFMIPLPRIINYLIAYGKPSAATTRLLVPKDPWSGQLWRAESIRRTLSAYSGVSIEDTDPLVLGSRIGVQFQGAAIIVAAPIAHRLELSMESPYVRSLEAMPSMESPPQLLLAGATVPPWAVQLVRQELLNAARALSLTSIGDIVQRMKKLPWITFV
jgi:transcriptional regulator with XRE-family HTH domain